MATSEYLVGIMYHDPISYDQWCRGLIEDYESSTGLFIRAESGEAAIGWGERVAEALLRHVNGDPSLDWKSFDYFCWIDESIEESGWEHCLDFFPHVEVGEWPKFELMTTEAYVDWQQRQAR